MPDHLDQPALDDDSLEFEATDDGPPSELSNRQNYNVVTDTVTGVNLRFKDNLIQALAIGISTLLGAVIGASVVDVPMFGLLVGAFVGMVLGLFVSGFAIMVYRGMSHMRGRHD